MNIPIFASEIQDGLADLINNNSIASFSVAKKAEPNMPFPQLKSLSDSELERLGIAKAENQNQLDLYYMQSVLVTTGWNKNDDVFDAQEMWAARSKPLQ